MRQMSIILGFERLIDSGRIRGHRVGLVCNLASIDKNLQHISTRFANEPSVTLNALFGPQHGFESNDQDPPRIIVEIAPDGTEIFKLEMRSESIRRGYRAHSYESVAGETRIR